MNDSVHPAHLGRPLDVKDESGILGNVRWCAPRAIGQLWGTCQSPFFADLHSSDTLVPALDHLSTAELERKWLALCVGVKDFAVCQLANVSHTDLGTLFGDWAIALLLDFDDQSRGKLGLL